MNKENEMSGACRTQGIDDKFILNLSESLNGREQLCDLDVDGKTKLELTGTKFHTKINLLLDTQTK